MWKRFDELTTDESLKRRLLRLQRERRQRWLRITERFSEAFSTTTGE